MPPHIRTDVTKADINVGFYYTCLVSGGCDAHAYDTAKRTGGKPLTKLEKY